MFSMEDAYLILFEQNPLPMLIYHRDSRFLLRFNHAALEKYGYTEDEVLKMRVEDLHAPDERDFVLKSISANTGILRKVGIMRHRMKDGTLCDMDVTTHDVFYRGQPARLSLLVDVTRVQQSQAERQLLTQERDELLNRLQLVLERMPLAVFITDRDMRVSYWNPAAERVFGYSAEEAIDRTVYDLIIPKPYHAEVRAAVKKVFKTNTSVRRTNPNLTKYGRRILFEWHNTPLVTQEGEVVGLLCMGEDITEKQLNAHRLEQSEQRFRSLFEESPVALWLEDFSDVRAILDRLEAAGVTDFHNHLRQHPLLVGEMNAAVKIIDVNAAAIGLQRARDKNHLLANLGNPVTDEIVHFLVEQFACLAEKLPVPPFELPITAMDGESVYVLLRSQVLRGYEDSLERVLISMADITRRRQVELAQIVNLNKLNLLNQAAVAINSATDLPVMLELVAEWAGRILNAELAGVSLLTEAGDALVMKASKANEAITKIMLKSAVEMRIDHPMFLEMLASGAPIRMNREEFAHQPHQHQSRAMFGTVVEMNSFMAVPMLDENRQGIGALHLMQHAEAEFSANDEALATQLAQIAAAAIEKQTLLDRLRAAEERTRELAQQVVGAQEQERTTIARELHDEAGQNLTALKLALQMAAEDLGRDGADVAGQIEDSIRLTETITNQTRELARILRPPRLELVSLEVSLQGLCRDFGKRMRIPIHYQGCAIPDISTHMALAIYRFIQEGLTNVARHAHASQVWVSLACDAEQIEISIQDDGHGFDTGELKERQGIGLRGMQERIALLNGQLSVDSRRGAGTRLSAVIPLEGQL